MRPLYPREVLSKARVPAFFITNLINIQYLTGLQLSAGWLLVRPTRFTLFVDGRYLEVAQSGTQSRVEVRHMREMQQVMSRVARCGCEAEYVTLAQRQRWRRNFSNTKFVQKTDIIEEFRRTKEPDELQKFRRAQRITRAIMQRIPRVLKPGLTEVELAWKLLTWVKEAGAEELAFDPIVAFGANTSRPHHQPTNRRLKARDIVQIDCGARFHGYCSDQSRVFFVGQPTALQQQVYALVERVKQLSEAAVRPGVTTHALDKLARDALTEAGYGAEFVHALGHGVGLEIHEGVSLSQKAKRQTLRKHEIITIEPGVYLPGKFGIRLEDEVVV